MRGFIVLLLISTLTPFLASAELTRADQELADLLLMNEQEFRKLQRVSKKLTKEIQEITNEDATLRRQIHSALAEKNPDGSPNIEALLEKFRAGDFNHWYVKLSPGLRRDIGALMKSRAERAASIDCNGKDRNKSFCKKIMVPAAQRTAQPGSAQ